MRLKLSNRPTNGPCDAPTNAWARSLGKRAPHEHCFCLPVSHSQRPQAAFTMVEIALSIAVVAFALVAIVGVLPTGFQVQKDNREDTIILQDGNYFLEAIRSGSQGLLELTNYVETVTISNALGSRRLTNSPLRTLIDGRQIIGFLSTPKTVFGSRLTNRVTATVRALSGSAAEKAPGGATDVAFRYLLISEVIPSSPFPTNLILSANNLSANNEEAVRQAYVRNNLYELRLTFRWPLLPNGDTGRGRRVFRTAMAGGLLITNDKQLNQPLYFFAPEYFQ